MSEKNQDDGIVKTAAIEKPAADQNSFKDRILRLNAFASSFSKTDDIDLEKADRQSLEALNALEATGGLQEMLAAQLFSIHRLQQASIIMARNTNEMSAKQYFGNAAIKLANTFVQQANLLSRLQGNGGQKIVVEHVDVHQGGQAIVGNVTGGTVKK